MRTREKDRREYQKRYREENRERLLEQMRRYYDSNKELLRAYGRKYRSEHPAPGGVQAWRKKNPKKAAVARAKEKRRLAERLSSGDVQLKRRFFVAGMKFDTGVSFELFSEMLVAQSGRCAICSNQFASRREPCADHCHSTDRPRALLCFKCNTGLGSYRDSPALLRAAADYIESFTGPSALMADPSS